MRRIWVITALFGWGPSELCWDYTSRLSPAWSTTWIPLVALLKTKLLQVAPLQPQETQTNMFMIQEGKQNVSTGFVQALLKTATVQRVELNTASDWSICLKWFKRLSELQKVKFVPGRELLRYLNHRMLFKALVYQLVTNHPTFIWGCDDEKQMLIKAADSWPRIGEKHLLAIIHVIIWD